VAEFIRPAAVVVPYSSTAISDGLRRLLDDGELAVRLRGARRVVMDRLSWSAVAEEQMVLYRRAM
jgi:glycosyltransferase involved in cell wall biosynthesis